MVEVKKTMAISDMVIIVVVLGVDEGEVGLIGMEVLIEIDILRGQSSMALIFFGVEEVVGWLLGSVWDGT